MKKQLLIALLAVTSFSSMQASALYTTVERILIGTNGILLGVLGERAYQTVERMTKLNEAMTNAVTKLEKEAAAYAARVAYSADAAARVAKTELLYAEKLEALKQDYQSCFVYGMGLAALGIMVVESDALKAGMESAGKAVDAAKEAMPQAVRLIGQTLPTTNTPRISKNQAYPTYTNAYAGKPLEATIYTNDAVTI